MFYHLVIVIINSFAQSDSIKVRLLYKNGGTNICSVAETSGRGSLTFFWQIILRVDFGFMKKSTGPKILGFIAFL
jgi:hypothetical protein